MSKKEVELMREVVPEEQKMYFDSLAELDYEFYVEYVNEGYHHGDHTKYICNKLQEAIEQKGAKRLIVTMPPQHSKSFTITETFPSFFLGRNPTKNVIGVGYSDDFAEKFGRRNKEKIKDFGAEIFDVHLSSKQAHKDWELEKGGGMISSGVGGQITGKRADCLPAGTKIETEIGKLDIDKLVNMEDKPKVLSYNHETGELEYRKVVAELERNSGKIIEFTTSSGDKIRSTDRHNFYVVGQGYKKAEDLRQGDRVAHLRTSNEQSSEMQHLWERENNRDLSLSKMLFQSEKDNGRCEMRAMWRDLLSKIASSKEEIKEGLRKLVLLNRLQKPTHIRETLRTLYNMWREDTEGQQVLLLNGMLQQRPRSKENIREEEMPRMSNNVLSSIFKNSILFEGLCRQSTFKENDRERKLSFQRWVELFEMVYRNETSNNGKRQPSMCALSAGGRNFDNRMERPKGREVKFSHTSHRRTSTAQQAQQSNNSMLNLSHNNAQVEIVEIERVERLYQEEIPVYDIQVEGTNNFFAEEILVHNCMIIDDPIKNRKEANSKRYRDTLWEEWESTLSTRLAEDAIVILVLTRWHEDDLAGRFLERFGDDWELLNFPALSEGKDTDLLNRPEDTALWEDQYSTEYLKKRRKELSAKAWNSLYMGNPNIEEGNQFKSTYFRYFRENDDRNAFILERPEGKKVILKEKCVCFQTVDSSFKVKTRNDYTVISTWYLTPNNDLLLYDVYRDKISVPDLWATLSNVMDRFNPSKVFVEDRASGTGLIQTAKREGRPVIPIPAESDKITRSFNISTFYENRAVYHKAETNWVADFEDELNTFPEGTNDDQVDTASIAGIVVSRGMIRTSSGNRGFVHTT